MEVVNVDLEDQERVINVYKTIVNYIPIVTIPIYIEAIYCIVKRSPNFQLHYTIILTAHILGCCFEEFYGLQLFRPLAFLPVVGIYADGILSMIGVHPFIQLYVMFLSIQINSAILTHITFYRMKIIIPVSYRHYTRVVHWGIFAIVFTYIGAILSASICFFLFEDQREAKQFLYATLRPLPSVFWSDKYIVSSPRNPNVQTFLIFGALCVGFYIFLCVTLPTLCFVILHKTRNSLSEKVIKAQRAYLRTILLQVLVVVVCIIIPFLEFFAAILHIIDSQMTSLASIIFALLHGSASTLTHLLSNKPFRDTIKAQMVWIWCVLTCTRHKRKNMVHTMSSIVG